MSYMNRISKEAAINQIKECLDRHNNSDSLDSADFIASILRQITGKNTEVDDEGNILIERPVEFDDICDHVADLIKEGFSTGVHPYFKLVTETEPSLAEMREIAHKVKNGFSEGYHPYWKIEY
jgi:hypothetical protein